MGTLRDLIDRASTYAEAMFDPDDCLTPHIIAEDAAGAITVVALSVPGSQIDRYREMMQLKLLAEGKRRWVFFSEAWMAEYPTGGPAKVEPVDHPERLEIVMFDAVDVPGNRRVAASRQIHRDGGGSRLMPLVMRREPARYRPSIGVER